MTKISIMFSQFDNKSVQSFTEDDIVNMYPIVKHINPRQVLLSILPPFSFFIGVTETHFNCQHAILSLLNQGH